MTLCRILVNLLTDQFHSGRGERSSTWSNLGCLIQSSTQVNTAPSTSLIPSVGKWFFNRLIWSSKKVLWNPLVYKIKSMPVLAALSSNRLSHMSGISNSAPITHRGVTGWWGRKEGTGLWCRWQIAGEEGECFLHTPSHIFTSNIFEQLHNGGTAEENVFHDSVPSAGNRHNVHHFAMCTYRSGASQGPMLQSSVSSVSPSQRPLAGHLMSSLSSLRRAQMEAPQTSRHLLPHWRGEIVTTLSTGREIFDHSINRQATYEGKRRPLPRCHMI